MTPLRIGLVGLGLIGIRHAELLAQEPAMLLAGTADPSEDAAQRTAHLGATHYADYRQMLKEERLDGVVIATPNQTHCEIGVACIDRGLPILVEKPIADTVAAGQTLVTAGNAKNVPIMVGHHRRFNPMVEKAHEIIQAGTLGRLIAVSAVWSVRKPDPYFAAAPWRTVQGGGPILINLIHDIDCLRHFAGEVEQVQALCSSAARGFDVEDTAGVILRLANGVIATITLSDTAPSPWNWEACSVDNPNIEPSRQNCYRILGSDAALDFPNLTLWRHAGDDAGDWGQPLQAMPLRTATHEALPMQLKHFAAVIRGEQTPRVSGREGLATLAATLAVTQAAAETRAVAPPSVA